MNGLVLIDKPGGCTSHDVVNRWRRLAKTKRTGHLGTLDPMATGLLILVTGPATRLAQFFGREGKTYEAEVTLGLTSNTYDIEGEVTHTGAAIPSCEAVAAALAQFRGKIMQLPPAVSAKKINGVPAYKLARQNVEVDLKPVEVEVSEITLHECVAEKLKITVQCSAGTYIRSIAHDLGRALGCGAVLSKLRRTHAGRFSVEAARTLDQLQALADTGRLNEGILPAAEALPDFPAEFVNETAEAQIRQGREFRTSPFSVPHGAPFVRAVSARSGDLVAIGQLRLPNLYHPGIVL